MSLRCFKFLNFFLTLLSGKRSKSLEFALIRYWTLVLHGSAIPPQRDDEPRYSPPSPGSSLVNNNKNFNNNNNYSLNTFYRNGNYGTTNPYITRSQQKSTTVPAQTATRKNGKQKNNGKGNKNNQRASTTARPIYTTVMLNQFSTSAKSAKNKSKVGQNSSNASLNKNTSTIRPPRITTPRTPKTKSQLNFSGGSSGGKNNNLLSKVNKLEPSSSNIYEKAPGKAPKQVKESADTTPTPNNPSMSKMFERYEKIEQIFPELKPYKDNNNPAYFTVTGNGKPSRENSKSFSSFVSMNSAPQKKNSPSDLSTVTRQQVTSQMAQENVGGKGTNQFNSVFHPAITFRIQLHIFFCLASFLH